MVRKKDHYTIKILIALVKSLYLRINEFEESCCENQTYHFVTLS